MIKLLAIVCIFICCTPVSAQSEWMKVDDFFRKSILDIRIPVLNDDKTNEHFLASGDFHLFSGKMFLSGEVNDFILIDIMKRMGVNLFMVSNWDNDFKLRAFYLSGNYVSVPSSRIEVFSSRTLNKYFNESQECTELFKKIIPSLSDSVQVFYDKNSEYFYGTFFDHDAIQLRAFFNLLNFGEKYVADGGLNVSHHKGDVKDVLNDVAKGLNENYCLISASSEDLEIPMRVTDFDLYEHIISMDMHWGAKVSYSFIDSGRFLLAVNRNARDLDLFVLLDASEISYPDTFVSKYIRKEFSIFDDDEHMFLRLPSYSAGVLQGLNLLKSNDWALHKCTDFKTLILAIDKMAKATSSSNSTPPNASCAPPVATPSAPTR